MSNPPGSVRNGIINRGNRRHRAEIIDRKLLFAYGFIPTRHTKDAAMLTGIAWQYTFTTDFPCMTCSTCAKFSRRRQFSLRMVSPDMASQQVTDYSLS